MKHIIVLVLFRVIFAHLLEDLKQLLLIAAIIGILLHNFSKFMIVASFEGNRDIIAKTLCVKKEEAGNNCQGKCYLKKQLDTESKKTSALSSDNVSSEIQFIESNFPVQFSLIQISSFDFLPYKKDSHLQFHFSFFHPPRQNS
ncbi:MAG: hypothetical protein NVV82_27275 [Sporocytophaga sp.]|nr:hypothetical protein [Sporocytophaga sp.]